MIAASRWVLGAILITGLPPALATAGTTVSPSFPNPLFAGADPDAMAINGALWIFPTGKADRLTAWSSDDMRAWRLRGVLIDKASIRWIGDDGAPRHYLWAPDVVAANGKYYLYYSVGPQGPTPSRIGVAVGERPDGPFRDSGRPLLTGGKGFEAIDPMVFIDPRSGITYLYAGGSAGARLRVFELSPDMLRIAREIPIDQPVNFTEGPFMHERGGTYYLSYSYGSWRASSYSVHYATAPTPFGPWRYRGAILESDGHYKGPGHHSFVHDPHDGGWLIVYHRWENQAGPGPYRGARQIAIERIIYSKDGSIEPVRMTGNKGGG